MAQSGGGMMSEAYVSFIMLVGLFVLTYGIFRVALFIFDVKDIEL